MVSAYQEYDAFQVNRATLLEMIKEAEGQVEFLGMTDKRDTLAQLVEKVRSERFKVLVLGEFKRGKSTLINALLGQDVLPAYVTPCTAIINEVKWGETKRAVVHFRDPLPDPLPKSLQDSVRTHLASGNGNRSIEVPVEDLEDYVAISDPAKDHAESVAESPFDHVDIFWPLDLCRNGVEIIDSPGLNEHGTRTKITMDYLTTVDAVLFVMSCQALASQSELHVIEKYIRPTGHEELFFIANRFNEVRQRDRERIVNYGREKLKGMTAFGEAGIFFISALDALDGRLDNDLDQIESSGVIPLENALSRFLAHDRGRIKLLQSSRELNRVIKEAINKTIPNQLGMLEASLSDLEARYANIKPRLDDAERRRRQIIEKVSRHRDRLRETVRRESSIRVREIANLVPEWTTAYEVKEPFSVLKLRTKEQIESIAKEVGEALSTNIEESQNEWGKTVLEPLIRDHLTEMVESIDSSVGSLLDEIDDIKAELSGVTATPETDEKDISPLERVVSAAGGFVIGGIGSALVGGTMGFKEMIKSLGPQIALVVGMYIVGITNPFIFIGALLAAGAFQGFLKQSSITAQTKKKVAEEMSKKLSTEAVEIAEKMAFAVEEKTEAFTGSIAEGLDREIKSVHQQVEEALRELKAGESQVALKRKQLVDSKTQLADLDSRLIDFIFSQSFASNQPTGGTS